MRAIFLVPVGTALVGLVAHLLRQRQDVAQLRAQLTQQRIDLEAIAEEVRGLKDPKEPKQPCVCVPVEPTTTTTQSTPALVTGQSVARNLERRAAGAVAQDEGGEVGAHLVAAEGVTPASEGRSRRLCSPVLVGAGQGCFTFTDDIREADLSSSTCDGSGVCQGCFIATDTNHDKTLRVIKCANALRTPTTQWSDYGTVYLEFQFLNADLDNALIVEACNDNACTDPLSTFTLQGGTSVSARCYTESGNTLFFPASDQVRVNTLDIKGGTIDNASINLGAGNTLDLTGSIIALDNGAIAAAKVSGGTFQAASYSFQGSTIMDGGTFQLISIEGGNIDNTDIIIPAGKTLDISAGTLTLADGQIPAAKVTGGIFDQGQVYSFQGSTVDFPFIDIDGGTIDNTDITIHAGKTLDIAAGTLTLSDGQIPAPTVTGGTFNQGQVYSFEGSTVDMENVTINGASITVGQDNTLDVSNGDLVLGEAQVPASKVGPGLFGPGMYFFTDSTIAYSGFVNYADIHGGQIDGVNIGFTIRGYGLFSYVGMSTVSLEVDTPVASNDRQCGRILSSAGGLSAGSVESLTVPFSLTNEFTPVVATAGPCTGGEPVVLNVVPSAGSFVVRVQNMGSSACTDQFYVYWLVVGI